jgi:alpha-tubulin suppressor-like RCC1 family protein
VLLPPVDPLLTGIAAAAGDRGVVLGNDSLCVATSDAGALCWGETTTTLGPGSNPPTTIPTPVDLSASTVGQNVSGVFAGGGATCVLVGNGTPLCWGANATGMLGHEAFGATDASAPLACLPASDDDGGPDDCANALAGVVKIAIGPTSLCFLDSSQSVRCMGSDADGALGAGLDGGAFTAPQAVTGVNALDLAVGGSHACAAPADASAPVVCWGANATGELGDAFDGGASPVPVAVPSLVGVKQLVAWSGGNCALKVDGSVWCWGADVDGQLARGGAGAPSPTPVPIPFLSYP